MASVTRTTVWVDGNTLTASALNGEFNNLLNALNLTDSDISGAAAISATKIAGTAATLGANNVFSGNNTFSGKNTFTATVPTIVSDSDGATITFNMNSGNLHKVTLGGNRTLAVSNVATNQSFVVILQQGAGGQTVTWWSNIKWVAGTVPTLSTGANVYDIFVFIYDGSNYYGSIYGLNHS